MPIVSFLKNARMRLTDREPVVVGGLTPMTSIDYPGQLSAVVFCQGCPWRCGYCHNHHLLARDEGSIGWGAVMDLLHRRQGLLDAVVFSGGEPTLQAGLKQAMQQVRELGYLVGLHTAGPYPERLAEVLPLVDWVGMDLKAPFRDYEGTTRVPGSGQKALRSARMLIDSGVAHQFRTTVHPGLLDRTDVRQLSRDLQEMGARQHVIQSCNTQHCLDEALRSPL